MKKEYGYFLGGMVSGGALGVLATIIFLKKKFMKELDRRVDEMEDYYQRTDEYDKRKVQNQKSSVRVKEKDKKLKTGHVKEKDRTNYAKAYDDIVTNNYIVKDGIMRQSSDEELLAESEYPEEDFEDEIDALESISKESDLEPRIISFEKAGELDATYDDQTLFYYMYNDTLTDDEGNVVDEPDLLLGNALEKYGFSDNDEKMIFVQNFRLRTLYEVEKIWDSFEY